MDGNNLMILAVEDEFTIRTLWETVLSKHKFNVLVAANGEEALRLYKDNKDDINRLLTDIMRPGLDGHELASKILEEDPDLPVLFMSGYVDHAEVSTDFLESKTAFLGKPFSPRRLVSKIEDVLELQD